MNRFSLNFKGINQAFEKEFRSEYIDSSIKLIRYSLLFGSIIFASFGILDVIIPPDEFLNSLITIRFLCIMPSFLILLFLTYTRFFRNYSDILSSVLVIYIGIGIIIMIYLVPPYVKYIFYSGVLFIIIYSYIISRMRFLWACAASWAVALIYELTAFFIFEPSLKQHVNYSYIFFVSNIFGMASGYSIEYLIRRDFFHVKQLKDEREKVFAMNRELEQTVEKKTSELLKINENLKLEIVARKFVESEIKELNNELEKRVILRTEQLQNALNELSDEVSTRKKAESELLFAKEQITEALEKEKELGKLKSQFIAHISHEYRTPLTVILSSTYLLDIFFKKRLEEDFQKQVLKIQRSVTDMTRLFENAMTVEKSEREGLAPVFENFELIGLINDIIKMLFSSENGQSRVEFTHDDLQLNIYSDKKLLSSAIFNVLDNAIKFSEKNTTVNIGVSCQKSSVNIFVKNHGVGIPPGEEEKIFEPFTRGSNVGAIPGAGLGLAIAERSLEALDGSISARTGDDNAVVFSIRLLKK